MELSLKRLAAKASINLDCADELLAAVSEPVYVYLPFLISSCLNRNRLYWYHGAFSTEQKAYEALKTLETTKGVDCDVCQVLRFRLRGYKLPDKVYVYDNNKIPFVTDSLEEIEYYLNSMSFLKIKNLPSIDSITVKIDSISR